jgi:hypothetical protein
VSAGGEIFPTPRGEVVAPASLPELAGVPWRARVNLRSLRRRGRVWTLSTACHTIPFVAAAVALLYAGFVR